MVDLEEAFERCITRIERAISEFRDETGIGLYAAPEGAEFEAAGARLGSDFYGVSMEAPIEDWPEIPTRNANGLDIVFCPNHAMHDPHEWSTDAGVVCWCDGMPF